jgi:signal transduction histidine kinase
MSMLERWFRFEDNGTTPATEVMAGLTTFMVMAYIIFVNPAILSFASFKELQGQGPPFAPTLAATCLVAGVMTAAMGLAANYPFTIASGMGRGFTRIVLRKTERQIPQLQQDNLRKVLISAEHLLNLINGLLDLSKIEAGRMEVFPEPVKLEEVIQVAASAVEPMVKDSRVQFVTQIAPDIPILNTDRQKLKQIVLNLLSNAAKFTEQGEIRLSAGQENGMLKLAVSDTGIGMKKEALGYIFDEFRQVDMSSTRKYQGTGLGLAIVKRLVRLLGGEIRVESELGKGSTFTVAIPTSLPRL